MKYVRLTGVDGAECKSEKSVTVRVLYELGADLLGELDSLAGDSHSANGDVVCVDVAAG